MPERPANEPPWALASLNLVVKGGLRRCPFCSSSELRLYEYAYAKIFAIDCKGCGAQGPRHSSPRRAQALWNARPATRQSDNSDRATPRDPGVSE